jgi:methylmalonyl-CoA/ethylmalonyl-CoA epimerase
MRRQDEAPVISTPLGPILQIAFVVEDLDAAVRQWARDLSVGPFFVLSHIPYSEVEFEGAPGALDISAAFAYSGDIQIELIEQHDDAPSVYRDAAGQAVLGLHHAGILSDDLVADEARLVAAGYRRVQRALSQTGSEVVYFRGPSPFLVELIRLPEGAGAFFGQIKQAAQDWDRASPFLNPGSSLPTNARSAS